MRHVISLCSTLVLLICIHLPSYCEEMHLGMEVKDVHLYVVTIRGSDGRSFGGNSAIRRLEVSGGKFHGYLKNLNDLAGAVQIDSKTDALRFVRLRTSYVTWNCWNTPFEFEIVQQSDIKQIPNFGVTSDFHDLPSFSGDRGMLSKADFRAGNFAAPRTEQTSDGYKVTRWILVIDVSKGYESKAVQLISETVGINGEYHRSTLINKPISRASNIMWGFPKKA